MEALMWITSETYFLVAVWKGARPEVGDQWERYWSSSNENWQWYSDSQNNLESKSTRIGCTKRWRGGGVKNDCQGSGIDDLRSCLGGKMKIKDIEHEVSVRYPGERYSTDISIGKSQMWGRVWIRGTVLEVTWECGWAHQEVNGESDQDWAKHNFVNENILRIRQRNQMLRRSCQIR